MEQAKFIYSPLRKVLEKQTKKQIDASKSSNLCNKIGEWKQTESIFPRNQLNDLIIDNLKDIKELQIISN